MLVIAMRDWKYHYHFLHKKPHLIGNIRLADLTADTDYLKTLIAQTTAQVILNTKIKEIKTSMAQTSLGPWEFV